MQMVWKNKNSKKRPHSSRSLGLPFEPTSPEREEAENDRNNRRIDAETTTSGRRGDGAAPSADIHENGDGEAEQIAQRLQEEGNRMAEVRLQSLRRSSELERKTIFARSSSS
jgi:hypothetical protein